MQQKHLQVSYAVADHESELGKDFARLKPAALQALKGSYAPYSGFHVSCALLLENGEIVCGTNQENAAYPAGICAEGIALGAAATLHPGIKIASAFITARSEHKLIDYPVTPCGICRQRFVELEKFQQQTIDIIMQGETGSIIRIQGAHQLLPLSFTGGDL
jgi:cytidine deaminase